MRTKNLIWIIIIIVLLMGTGGVYGYSQIYLPAQQTEAEAPLQTAVVRQGELTISATGAGSVIAATEIEVGFNSSSKLTELSVQVGDKVQAGDVLARLDSTAAEETVANAELQLAQAIMQTDASATNTGISYNDITIEQAQISLEQAQATLDDLLNWKPDPDEIALAEANLAAAQAGYNAARGNEASSGTQIQIQAINLSQAEQNLADAQAAYDEAFDPGRDWELNDPRRANQLEAERDNAERALSLAQDNLTIAQAQYNSAVASTNNSSSTNAQSSILSAEQALEAAQSGPTEDEIEEAQTAFRQAELALQQAQLNQEADQIALAQAQLNLQSAQETLEQTTLVAPMDGVITSVLANVGENVSGAIVTIADLDQPLLEVYMDESDLDTVGLDYEVEVVFDALPDDMFTGQVVQVDPMLQQVNGVSVIRAVVQLDAESFAKPQTLPIGLNATVEVIGGRAENALLVPVEALRELSPDEYAVFVMVNDEPQLRMVEVGLMDFTFAEITSGLESGDIVTTGILETE